MTMEPPISAGDVASMVSAPASDPYVEACAVEAWDLITAYAGARLGQMPASIRRRATLEVAADLYHRRSARTGIAGFDDSDVAPAPVRINRDPLVPARPILAPWMGVPIA